MVVEDIIRILDAEVLTENNHMQSIITSACGSDLMSDVMAYVKENVVLLTGLVNLQVIRTAEMMDIKVVIFVRGKIPDNSIIDFARDKDICVLKTKNPMFIACGKLYNAGIIGGGGW